jgi:phosphoribosylaminoimidazole-succinocarboxamide synthase
MEMNDTLLKSNLTGLNHVSSGKVRDMYDLGKELLIVISDRISAFDVIFDEGVPYKGSVLTYLSEFWFDFLKTPHHLITTNVDEMPEEVQVHREKLKGRAMLVRKAKPFPVECVARGYIIGSGWKDYQKTGAICGIDLPEGLQQAQKLSEPIFTPATKADIGEHDENISFQQMVDIIGKETAEELRDRTLDIYSRGSAHAQEKGVILADTKFEFGLVDGEIILIDEVLTPDSSRFWPQSEYQVGMSPPSFDKQFVRDHLESIGFNKKPPAPPLPTEIIEKTVEKYLEAYRLLTGKELPR